MEQFTLDCKCDDDKWVLTKGKETIKVEKVIVISEKRNVLLGQKLQNVHNIFNLPFESSYLSMYSCENCSILGENKIVEIQEICCKMFKMKKIVYSDDEDELYDINIDDENCYFIPIAN